MFDKLFEELGSIQASKNNDDIATALWLLPVLPVILLLLYSFILQKWNWGLMDDHFILSRGSDFQERLVNYSGFLSNWGVFRPVFLFHSAFFYSLFEHHPVAFYIFKMIEISGMLLIWGLGAYRITQKKISVILLPAVVFSFHYFYDSFLYLSSHEFLGLLFVGLALHFFLNDLENIFRPGSPQSKNRIFFAPGFSFAAGAVCLLLAFGSKETFFTSAAAFGAVFLYLAYRLRKKPSWKMLFAKGMGLVALTFGHAFFLLKFVKTNYSSSYDLNNTGLITANILNWLKKDFANHLPWIAATVLILFIAGRSRGMRKMWNEVPLNAKCGVLLGFFLYFGFLIILLPWNTISYYAAPFGIFFAFIVVLFISSYLVQLRTAPQIILVISCLFLNQVVCQYALNREATYHYDTENLVEWLAANPVFPKERTDDFVLCNSLEAAVALPWLTNRKAQTRLGEFHYWTGDPNPPVGDRKFDFFLISPRFHKIPIEHLKTWDIVFLSKFWTVYHRPQSEGRR